MDTGEGTLVTETHDTVWRVGSLDFPWFEGIFRSLFGYPIIWLTVTSGGIRGRILRADPPLYRYYDALPDTQFIGF